MVSVDKALKTVQKAYPYYTFRSCNETPKWYSFSFVEEDEVYISNDIAVNKQTGKIKLFYFDDDTLWFEPTIKKHVFKTSK